jgi:hypothetical protein
VPNLQKAPRSPEEPNEYIDEAAPQTFILGVAHSGGHRNRKVAIDWDMNPLSPCECMASIQYQILSRLNLVTAGEGGIVLLF